MNEFIMLTNLRKQRIKLTLLLVVASVLYALMYSFVNTIIYMGNLYTYYGAFYIFVIWCAYIFMILIFLFIQKKRGTDTKLELKSYILPLIGVQTILYGFMIVLGVGAFMISTSNAMLRSLASMVTMLYAIAYIPWQLCCFFQIYEGKKNPFVILWNALKKIGKHYQSCFYGLLLLFVCALCYQMIMSTFFQVSTTFSTFTLVQDIMLKSNPFITAMGYFFHIAQSIDVLYPALVSVVYGCVMCYILVHYYMLMICIQDEDIKV